MIAVPDGCAMYRMRTLEEIGWLDERHFDGLEAFDLSLRAALAGWKTVRVPGAHIRTASGKAKGEGTCSAAASGTFRRQLAAGNSLYVFYKNIPVPMRVFGFPMFAAAELAQLSSFLRRVSFTDDAVNLHDSFDYSGEGDVIDRIAVNTEPAFGAEGEILLGSDVTLKYDSAKYTVSFSSEPVNANRTLYYVDFKPNCGVTEFDLKFEIK
jgi:hypothetical protein